MGYHDACYFDFRLMVVHHHPDNRARTGISLQTLGPVLFFHHIDLSETVIESSSLNEWFGEIYQQIR